MGAIQESRVRELYPESNAVTGKSSVSFEG